MEYGYWYFISLQVWAGLRKAGCFPKGCLINIWLFRRMGCQLHLGKHKPSLCSVTFVFLEHSIFQKGKLKKRLNNQPKTPSNTTPRLEKQNDIWTILLLVALSTRYLSKANTGIHSFHPPFRAQPTSFYVFGRQTEMRKPWSSSSSEEDLDDIHLDDNVQLEDQRRSSRPECLPGPIHEIFLILVAALTGATFLILQRAIMVITNTVRQSLQLNMSAVAWLTAGSG